MASVLSLRLPSPVTNENNFPPIIYLVSFLFSSILIDFLIFSSLRWFELFFVIYLSSFSILNSGTIGYFFFGGSYLWTEIVFFEFWSIKLARSLGVTKKLSVGNFWTISSKNLLSLRMISSLNLGTIPLTPYILQILKIHWEAAFEINKF